MKATTTYNEAISELITAVNALDQAHSMLKDLDLHNYVTSGYSYRHLNVKDAVNIADNLLRALQNVKCPDCDKPMGESEACLSCCCPEVLAA
jgi:hypothetical protein